jgi:hypothetical protein
MTQRPFYCTPQDFGSKLYGRGTSDEMCVAAGRLFHLCFERGQPFQNDELRAKAIGWQVRKFLRVKAENPELIAEAETEGVAAKRRIECRKQGTFKFGKNDRLRSRKPRKSSTRCDRKDLSFQDRSEATGRPPPSAGATGGRPSPHDRPLAASCPDRAAHNRKGAGAARWQPPAEDLAELHASVGDRHWLAERLKTFNGGADDWDLWCRRLRMVASWRREHAAGL